MPILAMRSLHKAISSPHFRSGASPSGWLQITYQRFARLPGYWPPHRTLPCEMEGKRWHWRCARSKPPAEMMQLHLDALAAAYAETGQFENAILTAGRAFLAASPAQAEEIRRRSALYQAHRPYRISRD